MSDTTARKAVVTTAQVQAVLDYVNTMLHKLDNTHIGTEFDQGGRRGGFAEYRADDSTVRMFTTKAEALEFYTAFAAGMETVLNHGNVSVVEHASEAVLTEAATSRRKAQSETA